MGMVRNRAKVQRDIALAIERAQDAPVRIYRRVVWKIFKRIVLETPQFSGRAVANWNLGINSPDMSFDPNLGDWPDIAPGKKPHSEPGRKDSALHQRGDPEWANVALRRGREVLDRVRRGDKVYITNATRGDTFVRGGKASSEAYLADLQNPAFHTRLRAVNRPYETAMESAALIAEGFLAEGTIPIGDLTSNHG
ncbi:hypothetical protein H4CHR_02977 [Variovorax sp. PBS-H4]|uniref:hypothetical protein n=1 Tax=Variovorax sp. PBS-H4 TaxID=434008 RepID=UPI001319A177|nr:hypothetical protein [Variovorax sp. PBS-H4]VTU32264.1 hypothetical protein H4CHR_02977 [Variovorax sp. PBS-H4]